MNSIRPQFQKAKDAYLAECYPGDLAADVMARQAMRITPSRRYVRILIPAAIAAAALVVFVVLPKTPTPTDFVVITPPTPSDPQTYVSDHVVSTTDSTASESADTAPDLTSVLAVATDDESGVSFVPSETVARASVASTAGSNAASSDADVSFGFAVPSFPSAPSWDVSDTTPVQSSTTQEVL